MRKQVGQKPCVTCGTLFQPVSAQRYCGKPCKSPSMELMRRRGGTCRTCGTKFKDGRRQYCSEDCRPKYVPKPRTRKVVPPRICACGSTWTPKNEKVKTLLCPECREAERQAHVYSNKKGWRNAIRNRAQGLCEECGATEAEKGAYHHAHHKLPRVEGGLNTLANGILLCMDCHDAAHGGRALGGALLTSRSSDLVEQVAVRVVELLKQEAFV